jgi:hypothetical protein
MLGTAIAQVVTVYRGHHHILQAHGGHALGQVLGLVFVQRIRAAMTHITEGAASGADVTHDHEGGRAFAEALADIRAGGFFAHGMQFLITQNLFDFMKTLAGGQLGANPFRLFQFFIQRHDLDGDACGFGGAFMLDPCLVVQLHAVSFTTVRCFSSWGSSNAATCARVLSTPKSFICVTRKPS